MILPTRFLNILVCLFIIAQFHMIEAQKFSLKNLIDSAMLNYPRLKSENYKVEKAKAILTDAHHQGLPFLKIHDQIDLGTSNGIGGSYFPLSIIPSTSGGIRTENNQDLFSGNIAAAFFEHELFNFGLNHARIENAESQLGYDQANFNATSYSLQFQIAQLYFYVLKYKLLTNIEQKNIERNLVLYDYIKAYTGSGIKAGVDSSIAYAEISKAKIQYFQTLEKYKLIKSELAYYSGIKDNSFEIDTSYLNLSNSKIDSIRYKTELQQKRNNHPMLMLYKTKWESSLALERLTQKSFLPKIYLIGATWARGSSINSKDSYKDLSAGLSYSRYNYLAGIAVTYNLIDLIHQKDKSEIQKFQSQSVYEEWKEQESLLHKQSEQADIKIQSVMDIEKEIPNQLKAAHDAYAQKLAQYNAGLANITELTDAGYLLFRAESDAVESQSDLLNTLLQKAATNNTLNDFIMQFN